MKMNKGPARVKLSRADWDRFSLAAELSRAASTTEWIRDVLDLAVWDVIEKHAPGASEAALGLRRRLLGEPEEEVPA